MLGSESICMNQYHILYETRVEVGSLTGYVKIIDRGDRGEGGCGDRGEGGGGRRLGDGGRLDGLGGLRRLQGHGGGGGGGGEGAAGPRLVLLRHHQHILTFSLKLA